MFYFQEDSENFQSPLLRPEVAELHASFVDGDRESSNCFNPSLKTSAR
jgi:hypothetical protein